MKPEENKNLYREELCMGCSAAGGRQGEPASGGARRPRRISGEALWGGRWVGAPCVVGPGPQRGTCTLRLSPRPQRAPCSLTGQA